MAIRNYAADGRRAPRFTFFAYRDAGSPAQHLRERAMKSAYEIVVNDDALPVREYPGSFVTRAYERAHRPITARITNAEHASFAKLAERNGVAPATYMAILVRLEIARGTTAIGPDEFEHLPLQCDAAE